MRIVGGACKKRPLKVPGKDVRPTRGMVREAIFNILSGKFADALVLDVFAGSGALGIEALSRGARHCTFVEKRPAILRQNISALELSERALILSEDFRPALRRSKKGKFDVIFADPPYNKKLLDETMDLIARYDLLAPDGVIVAEHSSAEDYEIPDSMITWKRKKYGDTTVSFIVHGNH